MKHRLVSIAIMLAGLSLGTFAQAQDSLEEQERIEAIPTDSPEAYALYLRAVDGCGFECLEEAIELDPEFALAYAEMAVGFAGMLRFLAGPGVDEVERLVRDNAAKALSVDPNLALAHVALGLLEELKWQRGAAEESFDRAIQLSPNDPQLLTRYAAFRRNGGDYTEAIRMAQRAVQLDPYNVGNHHMLGTVYIFLRNHTAALAAFRKALEVSPSSTPSVLEAAFMESLLGDHEAALRELRVFEELWEMSPPWHLTRLIFSYAKVGRRDEALRVFDELDMRRNEQVVGSAHFAVAHMALGDYEQALQRLETAVDSRAPHELIPLMEIKANIWADPVFEEDPRFVDLRSRIGESD